MDQYLLPLGVSLAALLVTAVGLWLLSLRLEDASIVDIFWGPLFALQVIVYTVVVPGAGIGFDGRRFLVLALVLVWATRLSTHLAGRKAGKPEDYRYAEWREQAGDSWWWRSFFKVFALQAGLAWVIGVPILAALIGTTDGWTLLDAAGLLLWGIGFAFEAIGDVQLAAFTADDDNKGTTLNTGLWRYTRHPNYFGDAAQWWGIWLIATAAGGWWTIFAPILMTALLLWVSGVGKLEQSIADRREGYREYMETTSPFIPWFPKRKGGDA